jgi:hypothetical protein
MRIELGSLLFVVCGLLLSRISETPIIGRKAAQKEPQTTNHKPQTILSIVCAILVFQINAME